MGENQRWYGPEAWFCLLIQTMWACYHTRGFVDDPAEVSALAHAERGFLELMFEVQFEDALELAKSWMIYAGEEGYLGGDKTTRLQEITYGPDEWIKLIEEILYARDHTLFYGRYVGEYPDRRPNDLYEEESRFRRRFSGRKSPCDNLIRRLLVRAKLWRSTAVDAGRF